MQDFVKLLDDGILVSGQDNVTYKVQFNPFRIVQYVDGKETIIVNDNDNLFYEAKDLGPQHVYQPPDLYAHGEHVVEHKLAAQASKANHGWRN